MTHSNCYEVRTDDNLLICRARLIEGDILLTMKSAGKEIHVPYTDIPRLLAKARRKGRGSGKES